MQMKRISEKIVYFIKLVVETPNYGWIIVLQCISGMFNFIGLPLIIPLLGYLQPGGSLVQTQSSFDIFNRIIQFFGLKNDFYVLLFFMSILILSSQLLVILSNLIAVWAQVKLSRDYRKRLLRYYAIADWFWLINHHSSEINHAVIIEADYASVAHLNAQRVMINSFQAAFYLALAIALSLRSTILAFMVYGLLGIINILNSRLVGRLNKEYNKELRLVSNLTTGFQQNKKFFKTSTLGGRFAEKIIEGIDRIVTIIKNVNLRQQLQTGWSFTFTFIFLIALVVFYDKLLISYYQLVLIVLVFNRLAPQFTNLSDAYLAMNSYIPMHISLIERLNDLSEHTENNGTRQYDEKKPIKFEKVCFTYPDGKWTISDVNLEIKPGKTIAFIGESGAGKSTILDLTLGLLKPTSGNIYYGDIPHNELDIKSFREQVAYVNQSPTLLDGTIRDNLLIAKPDASDETISAVCHKVQLSSLINGLPKGLNTIIGENGVKLSGGQRQRVVLARSLLMNPKILILDEATSELDLETEMLIQETINGLSKDLTIIIVAHRLSTVNSAELIYVLEKGKICEVGTYKELLDQKGRLYYLDSLQKNK